MPALRLGSVSYGRRSERRPRLRVGRRGAWLGFVAVVLLVVWLQFRQSLVLGASRFNFVLATEEGRVGFVSVDGVEKKVIGLDLPGVLAIRSRSVGEYQVNRLYALSLYEKDQGNFVQRKIQGFLRAPVSGYMLVSRGSRAESSLRGVVLTSLWQSFVFSDVATNISLVDRALLLWRVGSYVWYGEGTADLSREGVLTVRGDGYGYVVGRLQRYVEGRFFDWDVAKEGLGVAVVNVSGEPGLASDVSDFIANVGSNVVMVREGEGERQESTLLVSSSEYLDSSSVSALRRLLDISSVEVGETDAYRSNAVLFVGADMQAIF